MLKMYHDRPHAGDSPDLWEENWRAAQFEQGVRFCAIDPLRPLFEEYLKPGGLMLEGGCGMGTYVTYYAARGFKVVGLDFAQKALKTLKERQPQLVLCGGDVSKLPFADKTFDLYYSGGVVEHFEGGAEESLREARRVLKDDGVMLISVTYFNPLRRIIMSGGWSLVPRSRIWELTTRSSFNTLIGQMSLRECFPKQDLRQ
jgi:ubiquinone/menaquinone biosynthesis C-methylase UbiE